MVSHRVVSAGAVFVLVFAGCSGSAQNTPVAEPAAAPSPAVSPVTTAAPLAPETTAPAPAVSPVTTAAPVAPETTAPAARTPATENPTPAAPVASGTTHHAPLSAMPTGLQGPPQPWEHMDAAARGHWMGHAVLPAMSALFREYNPTRYASVTCATCHGENAREVHFHMPNNLPGLPAPMSEGWNRMMTDHSRLFHFMAERVEPTQAQLLGMQPFNPQTRQGFGCFNCHPHEGT